MTLSYKTENIYSFTNLYSSLFIYQGDVLVLGTAPASPPIPSPLPHGISTAAKWLQYVRSLHAASTSASLPADSVDRSSHNAPNDTDASKPTVHTAGERPPFKSLSEGGVGGGTEGSREEGRIDKDGEEVFDREKGSVAAADGLGEGEKEGEKEGEGDAASPAPAVHGTDGKDTDVAPAPSPLPDTAERAITEASQLIVTHHADDVSGGFYKGAITAIPEDDFAERTVRAAVLLHINFYVEGFLISLFCLGFSFFLCIQFVLIPCILVPFISFFLCFYFSFFFSLTLFLFPAA
jgi:hypothetical protein